MSVFVCDFNILQRRSMPLRTCQQAFLLLELVVCDRRSTARWHPRGGNQRSAGFRAAVASHSMAADPATVRARATVRVGRDPPLRAVRCGKFAAATSEAELAEAPSARSILFHRLPLGPCPSGPACIPPQQPPSEMGLVRGLCSSPSPSGGRGGPPARRGRGGGPNWGHESLTPHSGPAGSASDWATSGCSGSWADSEWNLATSRILTSSLSQARVGNASGSPRRATS
jgi:hypothetical protein